MSVACVLQTHLRGKSGTSLPQINPSLLRRNDQVYPRPLEEPDVGRVGDRLLHDRCIDRRALHAALVDAPDLRSASMVLVSSPSTPSSTLRLRHCVKDNGSIGKRCYNKISPMKCWKYGFSTPRAAMASSDNR